MGDKISRGQIKKIGDRPHLFIEATFTIKMGVFLVRLPNVLFVVFPVHYAKFGDQ